MTALRTAGGARVDVRPGSLLPLAQASFASDGSPVETFDGSLDAVRAARRFVDGVLGSNDGVRALAALVASELAANAVLHARTPFVVAVSPRAGGVRLSVGDLSPALPVPAPPSESSETGRGLLLVGAMSTAWGCEPWATGKVVWAELSPD